ncbi:hypothetical protein NM219_05700 [Parvimonas micra]|uniref:hypothetical protein n=1 Tax=Parvimonas micra TaxID=33033 RepID=UPI0022B69B26|nr:hypothetical protein [Parvimonas micra]WBB32030.1 hypothetical protein NM221_05695 [Parvimonas micra]WBB33518.1 hypothetical protein NM220_05700 [Parvimonas micra]WBB35039.1 hypothetical protein NM219_05700 [Parvimonas micra]
MKELENKRKLIKDKLRKLNNFKIEFEEYKRKEKEIKRNIGYGKFEMKIQGFYELLEEERKNINTMIIDDEENLQTSLKYINNKMENEKK